MKMKKSTRWMWIGSITAFLLLCAGLLFTYTDILGLDAQAIEISREWARLDPLPASATQVDVNTEGSMFSREFIVTFTAPQADIEAWLATSPGTAAVTPDMKNKSVRVYHVQPGGGAQFAEVKVDERTHTVTINTYWS